MRLVKAATSLGALASLLTFGAFIGGWLPRFTGLVAAGLGILLVFLLVILNSNAPVDQAAAPVKNEPDRIGPASAYSMVAVGPYSPRDIDPVLQDAIASGHSGKLLLVSGEPSSGKTRAAWMAVQAVRPDALLYSVDEPRYGNRLAEGLPLEAARAALDTSAYDVLWLDDVSLHLGRGLTTSILQEFADRQVLVVATIQESALDSLHSTDPELWIAMRDNAGAFRMSAELSAKEVDSLDEAYHHLGSMECRFLPAHLAQIDFLSDRFRLGALSCPLGLAYVVAAWLWQTLGMPRYCPAPHLRAIVDSLVHGQQGDAKVTEAEHQFAIEWATAGADGREGLLIRSPFLADSFRSSSAVDDLVEASYGSRALIEILSAVVAAANPHDSLAVARATALFLSSETTTPPSSSVDHIAEGTFLLELANALLSQVERDST